MVATIIIAFFFSTFTLVSSNMIFGSSDNFESPQTSPKQAVLVVKLKDPKGGKNAYRYQLGIKKILIPYVPRVGIPIYALDQADETWLTAHYGKDFLTNPNLPLEIKEAPKRYLMNECAYKFLIPADQRLTLNMEFVRTEIKPKDISEFRAVKEILAEDKKIIEVGIDLDSEGKISNESVTIKETGSVDLGVCPK